MLWLFYLMRILCMGCFNLFLKCVCVCFVMCGCFDNCLGVLVVCVLVFTVFCIVSFM